MKTFIKITEIWIPNKQRTHLEFADGIYGKFKEFGEISAHKQFAYQQGLPGNVWATGHPIIITELESPYYERTEAAQKAGLTCAIGMPVMAGEFLMAVIVFLCGGDENHMGAIEVWANTPEHSNELNVIDGYYGTLDYFENISRKTTLVKGSGLPGIVWEKECPIIMEDIGNSSVFIRSRDAKKAEITKGIGIPVAIHQKQVYIMTFLSAKSTPIAKRMQIWLPDKEHKKLLCQTAYGKENNALASIFECKTIAKGEGSVGRAWLTGVPVIGKSNINGTTSDPAAISSLLAVPVIDKGALTAVVTFLF